MRHLLGTTLAVLALAACASSKQNYEERPGWPQVITEGEIAESRATTAYDAILKLRGNFLSNRGKTTVLGKTSPLPVVYLDGVQYGEIATLRNIPAPQIASIKLYRMAEASHKFGRDKTGGVIEVLTKTQ
jgi:outer membrane cobalamin receptor